VSRESTKARRSARRRVFVADPPLASLVDAAVAQLKIHRQYPTHRRRNRGLLEPGVQLAQYSCSPMKASRAAPSIVNHHLGLGPVRTDIHCCGIVNGAVAAPNAR